MAKGFRRSAKRQGKAKQSPGASRRLGGGFSRYDRPLRIEQLEDRRVLALYVVTNPFDLDNDGNIVPGSLRQAINLANANFGGDTIAFSETALISAGGTITLSNHANGGELLITDDLVIAGPGARKITVSQGKNDSRVFHIDDGDEDNRISVTITGIQISNARLVGTDDEEDRGAAIRNVETLTLNEVRVSNNSASGGGGGLFNTGTATINRSLFINNTAGFIEGVGGGGGILNGLPEDDENSPVTNISNSTFTGNSEAIRNYDFTVNIENSTVVENTLGVTSAGNPIADPPEEGMDPAEDPPPVIFTNITHSIFATNGYDGDGNPIDGLYDLSTIGTAPGATEEDPPRSLAPSIFSQGWNIYGIDPALRDPRQFTDPPADPRDPVEVDPTDLIGDPGLLPLADYGGSVDTFVPDVDASSIAIDAGDPEILFSFDPENRGRQFARIYGAAIDIGATEAQEGNFVVDTLIDDNDGQYWGFASPDGLDELGTFVLGQTQISRGDFSLREAIRFADRNPGVDTITFSQNLLINPDTTPSKAKTITLTIGALNIATPMIIQGPKGFELEVDASGTDPSPTVNNADGTSVFRIDDGDVTNAIDVEIANLTIMGGDAVDRGGGIYSRENLTLRSSWVKDNAASNDGGGVFIQFGDLTIDSSTISNNSAADDGGGVFFDISTFGSTTAIKGDIVNSTITGNQAGDKGAGIGNQNGDITIRHSTITLNSSASLRGSGVATFGGPQVKTTIRSSIVSGNANNDVEYFSPATIAKIVSQGYNLIGSGNALAAFNKPGDHTGVLNPVLAPLGTEGGFTPIHRPLTGSPVIDAGDPADAAGVGNVPNTDQRGGLYTRVFDGDQDGTSRIDIGAYEVQGVTYLVDNPIDENDGIYTVGNLSLREAIELANINPLPDFIVFDPTTMFDMTIGQSPRLPAGSGGFLQPGTTSDMKITDSLTITGLGLDFLTIDTESGYDLNNPSVPKKARLFTIDDGDVNKTIDVTIQDLRIANGVVADSTDIFGNPLLSAGPGGVIYSTENLTLEGLFFVNHATRGDGMHGGAIYQQGGSLTFGASPITGNSTTITGVSTEGVGAHGGAVAALNATVLLRDDTSLSGNSTTGAGSHGGGVYMQGGTLTVDQSSITGNGTIGGAARGGGVYATAATVHLIGGNVSGNSTIGANGDGAGIYSNGSTILVESDSTLGLNQTIGTVSKGAGIYANGGSVVVSESRVTQNKTSGNGSTGGGIFATNAATVSLTGSTVSGNETSGTTAHGGGIYNTGSVVTIRDSLIALNKVNAADAVGGGIWSDTNLTGTQATTIVNSTLSSNVSGGRGGALYNADGRTTILNSTVTANQANNGFYGYGGGIASFGTTAVQTIVGSSIVAGNVGSDVDQVLGNFTNTFSSNGYNVIGVGLAAPGFASSGDKTNIANPLLGGLAPNGGPTFTHALLEGSPAINAGSPTFNGNSFTPPLTTDQRGVGFDRVLNGRIDAGAFESTFGPAPDADFNGSGKIDGSDFLAWQRGKGIASGATKAQGDADGDGAVGASDLAIWKTQYGSTTSSAVVAVLAAAESGGESAPAAAPVVAAAPLPANGWLTLPAVETSEPSTTTLSDEAYASYSTPTAAAVAGSFWGADDSADESLFASGDSTSAETVADAAFVSLESEWLGL